MLFVRRGNAIFYKPLRVFCFFVFVLSISLHSIFFVFFVLCVLLFPFPFPFPFPFLSFSFLCLHAWLFMVILCLIYTTIIIYNILISFVCVRVYAHARTHDKDSEMFNTIWHNFFSYIYNVYTRILLCEYIKVRSWLKKIEFV